MMSAIQPTNERMTYQVRSETNPRICYRVDLLANGGAGWCQCFDFATRRQPNLDAGELPMTEATTCKHLRNVHRAFLLTLLTDMAKADDRQ